MTSAPNIHWACDNPGCMQKATHIHLVPYLAIHQEDKPMEVRLCCDVHDPYGYWFPLGQYFAKDEQDFNNPGELYSFRKHLRQKINGDNIVAQIDAALIERARLA